jgi:hypothetical protein
MRLVKRKCLLSQAYRTVVDEAQATGDHSPYHELTEMRDCRVFHISDQIARRAIKCHHAPHDIA